MKRLLLIAFAAALLALSAGQLLAIQTGTWTCMGYTITVVPDFPDNPNLSGTIQITKEDDYATVNLTGTYVREKNKMPVTVVSIWGYVTVEDTPIEISQDAPKVFSFDPGPQRMVWRTIISWVEGLLAS